MHEHSVKEVNIICRSERPKPALYEQLCSCGASRTLTVNGGKRTFGQWDEPTKRINYSLRPQPYVQRSNSLDR